MAEIKIKNIQSRSIESENGSELLLDSESFMDNLDHDEIVGLIGGIDTCSTCHCAAALEAE